MLTDHEWALIDKAATAIGLGKDASRKWREPNRDIPAARVPELSRRTKIPMKRLRPDLFDVPRSEDAA